MSRQLRNRSPIPLRLPCLLLNQLRKEQLLHVAQELGIQYGPRQRVTELRTAIRNHFENNPRLLNHPNYTDLLSQLRRQRGHQRPRFQPVVTSRPQVQPAPPQIPLERPLGHQHPRSAQERNPPPQALSLAHPTPPDPSQIPLVELPPAANRAKGRPAIVPELTAGAVLFRVPDPIKEEFRNGWNSHVPLTFFTDRYCTVGFVPEVMYTKHSTTGRLLAVEKSSPEKEEHNLGFDEWHQAWRRLLNLLETHLAHLYSPWKSHYERILNAPTRAYQWEMWRLYDIEIRKQSTYEGIDPAIFSEPVWDLAESRTTKARLLASIETHIDGNKKDTGLSSSNHSLRGIGTSNNSRRNVPNRCLFCGDKSGHHASTFCPTAKLINGNTCILIPHSRDDKRCDKYGDSYCSSWNGISGCTQGDQCQNGKHKCSLCAGRHGAQSCTVV